MTTCNIIDEDICANCAHKTLLEPVIGSHWEAPAICIRGWPYTLRFWNVISTCPSFEVVGNDDAQKATP
jgi:hypothetical protein